MQKKIPALRRLRALMPFRDPRNNKVTIIIGSGRSGTTWLTEQVALSTRGRIIFEPLHPRAVCGRAPILTRTYLAPDAPHPEMRDFFDLIVQGSIRNAWTDRYNDRFSYDHRVIKMIRANLALGWIARNYPHAQIALVLRAPTDVAKSSCTSGWPLEIERFRSQPNLMRDYPFLASDTLSVATTQFEKNFAHWAVENRVALDQFEVVRREREGLGLFFYDTMKRDLGGLREFLEFAGPGDTEAALAHAMRPSRVSRIKARKSGAAPQKYVPTSDEMHFAHRLLEELSLDQVFSANAGQADEEI